jgi:hypothetical protein
MPGDQMGLSEAVVKIWADQVWFATFLKPELYMI